MLCDIGNEELQEIESQLYSQIHHSTLGDQITNVEPKQPEFNFHSTKPRYYEMPKMQYVEVPTAASNPCTNDQNAFCIENKQTLNNAQNTFSINSPVPPFVAFINPPINNFVMLPPSTHKFVGLSKRHKARQRAKQRKKDAQEKIINAAYDAELFKQLSKDERKKVLKYQKRQRYLERKRERNKMLKKEEVLIKKHNETILKTLQQKSPIVKTEVPLKLPTGDDVICVMDSDPEDCVAVVQHDSLMIISSGDEEDVDKTTKVVMNSNEGDDDVLFVETNNEINEVINLDTEASPSEASVAATPESANDFLDHERISTNGSDFVPPRAMLSKSLTFGSESSCSASDISTQLKNPVFGELEFDSHDKELFADNNLDSFSDFITPRRSSQGIPSLLTTVENDELISSNVSEQRDKTNSDSSSESDYGDKQNKVLPNLSHFYTENNEEDSIGMDDASKRDTSLVCEKGSVKKKVKKKAGDEEELSTRKKKKKRTKGDVSDTRSSGQENDDAMDDSTPAKSSKKKKQNVSVEAETSVIETENTAKKKRKKKKSNSQDHSESDSASTSKKSKATDCTGDDSVSVSNNTKSADDCLPDDTTLRTDDDTTEADCSTSTPRTKAKRKRKRKSQLALFEDEMDNAVENETLEESDIELIEPTIPLIDLGEDSDAEQLDFHSDISSELSDLQNVESDLSLVNVRDGNHKEKYSTFADVWTEDQDEFYRRRWIDDDYTLHNVLSDMPDDPDKWKIIYKDRAGFAAHRHDKRCRICSRFDHLMRNCPDRFKPKQCRLCGEVGHTDTRCPNMMCTQCGHRSNYEMNYCSRCAQWRYEICKYCKIKGHPKKKCPDYWRRYHLTTNAGPLVQSSKKLKPKEQLWCPGCGRSGHSDNLCGTYAMHMPTTSNIIDYNDVYGGSTPTLPSTPKTTTSDVSLQPTPLPLMQSQIPVTSLFGGNSPNILQLAQLFSINSILQGQAQNTTETVLPLSEPTTSQKQKAAETALSSLEKSPTTLFSTIEFSLTPQQVCILNTHKGKVFMDKLIKKYKLYINVKNNCMKIRGPRNGTPHIKRNIFDYFNRRVDLKSNNKIKTQIAHYIELLNKPNDPTELFQAAKKKNLAHRDKSNIYEELNAHLFGKLQLDKGAEFVAVLQKYFENYNNWMFNVEEEFEINNALNYLLRNRRTKIKYNALIRSVSKSLPQSGPLSDMIVDKYNLTEDEARFLKRNQMGIEILKTAKLFARVAIQKVAGKYYIAFTSESRDNNEKWHREMKWDLYYEMQCMLPAKGCDIYKRLVDDFAKLNVWYVTTSFTELYKEIVELELLQSQSNYHFDVHRKLSERFVKLNSLLFLKYKFCDGPSHTLVLESWMERLKCYRDRDMISKTAMTVLRTAYEYLFEPCRKELINYEVLIQYALDLRASEPKPTDDFVEAEVLQEFEQITRVCDEKKVDGKSLELTYLKEHMELCNYSKESFQHAIVLLGNISTYLTEKGFC